MIIDKLNNRHDKLAHAFSNTKDNKFFEEKLTIPIVGGFLYLFYKLRQGFYWKEIYTSNYKNELQRGSIIKEELQIKNSLRKQLDSVVNSKKTVSIEINDKYLTKFSEVMREYEDSLTIRKDPKKKNRITLIYIGGV